MKSKRSKSLDQMNWNSLASLKGHIERNIKGEKVEQFVGHTLTTNKAIYTLGPDGLNIKPK